MPPEQAEHEKEKYEMMWQYQHYRKFSPGERILDRFPLTDVMKKMGVKTILDAGCGSGKLMRRLLEDADGGFDVKGFDIADNCLDPYFEPFKHEILKVGVLWDADDFNQIYDAIFCTDVLEHIPTDRVAPVLKNLFTCSRKLCFLGISLIQDSFGPGLLGEPLHLTVQPAAWWIERIKEAGFQDIQYLVDKDPTGRDYWLHAILLKGS